MPRDSGLVARPSLVRRMYGYSLPVTVRYVGKSRREDASVPNAQQPATRKLPSGSRGWFHRRLPPTTSRPASHEESVDPSPSVQTHHHGEQTLLVGQISTSMGRLFGLV